MVNPSRTTCPTTTSVPAASREPRPVSVELVGLALLMGLATYPSRALPLLARLAVAVCAALVAWRRNLFIGLVAAVALVTIARALGVAEVPV